MQTLREVDRRAACFFQVRDKIVHQWEHRGPPPQRHVDETGRVLVRHSCDTATLGWKRFFAPTSEVADIQGVHQLLEYEGNPAKFGPMRFHPSQELEPELCTFGYRKLSCTFQITSLPSTPLVFTLTTGHPAPFSRGRTPVIGFW